ncbi:histidine--tRNA ligase family protein [Patescibacteria group bacterium]|nr:histidine--tRNA ligase family protein [Patescibacteria group bacterium]
MSKKRDLKSVNGFKSIYPEDWLKWQYIQNIVEKTVESFGFKRISAPSIERRSLYEVKPPWSEGLISQTFSFFDNQKNYLTLIPEQTPTRSRMVQELKKIELPIRWYDTSKRWRQEDKIKNDRAKEFLQTDIDIIGCDSVEADADILACAASIYKSLGLGKEVEISINDRKLLENILFYAGVKPKDCYAAVKIVDDKEKISRKEFHNRFKAIGLANKQIAFIYRMISLSGSIINCVQKVKKINKNIAKKSDEILKRFIQLSDILKWYGVYDMCRLDLSIARGSFYTGIIFEVSDKNKKLGALSGGGRYDWLISMYGERDLPAIGFGFGYMGTIEKLEESKLLNLPPNKSGIFVSCENPKKNYKMAIELVNILREKDPNSSRH